ncbi:MAG: PhzF family phenazine biosynthesis protein [Candidatus Eisenbacteria bacterium]|uniref:PhzF family phenazine biosynthesis protein n=1 Tax=Eiseniibacteriota bacterium TaxID=2212470 RepID=A0A538TRI6_UNCEI|nr:MAG: PhzF family phenazine biosynthesis protein [Candidatus Eisenbacteria bacterium]
MRAIIVDAFTSAPGAGNRAGIIPDAAPLLEKAMQRAATAIAAAETAFVLPPPEGAAVRLRYFTPAAEIAFCGHATVATFHWLAETGALTVPGRHTLDCPAGKLEIEIERDSGGGCRVWMATPRHPFEPGPIAGATLMGLLGGTLGMRDQGLPIERAGRHLYVPIKRRSDLWSLTPQWDALATEGDRHEVRGFYAFTRDVIEPGSLAHGRYFAPSFGVREDPVTGSASGPLAEYLARHGILVLPPGGGTVRGRVEQGDAMGKPGRPELEVTGTPERITGVRVGGVAVTVLEGQLRLD